jgi:hypothetical protein
MLKIKTIKPQDLTQVLAEGSFEKIETYIELAEIRGKARGTVYPISLKSLEEYQLPLSATEHFVVCIAGEIVVRERNSGQENVLTEGQLIRVTKSGNKEYPNLQIKSLGRPSEAYWIPIHTS